MKDSSNSKPAEGSFSCSQADALHAVRCAAADHAANDGSCYHGKATPIYLAVRALLSKVPFERSRR